jgi:flavodoxin
MKALIICESVHHGNTKKVADAIAEVLKCEVRQPGEVDPIRFGEYDLVGFGSGIYGGKFHRNVLKVAEEMPAINGKVFVFSTSGGPGQPRHHQPVKDILAGKGCSLVGEFNCRGYDTFGPLKLVGGLSKGKPDETDLKEAREFAAIVQRKAGSEV